MKFVKRIKNRLRAGKTGMAWYRREQWKRLRQVSEDKDQLEEKYDDWLALATQTLAQLQADGLQIEKVEVDVNELPAYCAAHSLPVNSQSRSSFVADKLSQEGAKRG
jgi:hypothetical protein